MNSIHLYLIQEEARVDERGCGVVDDGWADAVTTQIDQGTSPECRSIGSLLKKCRQLTTMVKKSSKIKNFFDRVQPTSGVCRTLRIDVRTRWNSTLKMLDSFLSLKETVCRFFDEKESLGLRAKQVQKLDRLELNSNEWSLLKILSQLLKPFDSATKLLSAQRYPTIGLCLFVVHHLKLFLEDTDADNELQRQLKKLLLNSTIHYIDNEEEQMRILQVTSI
jgi:hypothetical protein